VEQPWGNAQGLSMKRSKARLCHFLEAVDPDPNTFYLVPNFFIQLVTAKARVLHHGS
jgi:hypothetical protein